MRTPSAFVTLIVYLFSGCARDRANPAAADVPPKIVALRPALEEVRRGFAGSPRYVTVTFVVSVAPRWSQLRVDADEGTADQGRRIERQVYWSPATIGRTDTAVVTVVAKSAAGSIANAFTIMLVWRAGRWELPPELSPELLRRALEGAFHKLFPSTRATTTASPPR